MRNKSKEKTAILALLVVGPVITLVGILIWAANTDALSMPDVYGQ